MFADFPPVHLTPAALRQRFTPELMRPSFEIDYAAETGMKPPTWPKKLQVRPGTNVGPVQALIRAVYGPRALPERPIKRDAALNREFHRKVYAGAFDPFPLACPAYRVLGRRKIAQWLNITKGHLPEFAHRYPWVFKKVGWLWVADAQDLQDVLDLHRRAVSKAHSHRGVPRPRR